MCKAVYIFKEVLNALAGFLMEKLIDFRCQSGSNGDESGWPS